MKITRASINSNYKYEEENGWKRTRDQEKEIQPILSEPFKLLGEHYKRKRMKRLEMHKDFASN